MISLVRQLSGKARVFALGIYLFKNRLSIKINQSNIQFELAKVWVARYPAILLKKLLELETAPHSLLPSNKDWEKTLSINCVTLFVPHGQVS